MQIHYDADYLHSMLTLQGTDADTHHLFDLHISVKGSKPHLTHVLLDTIHGSY